MSSATVAELTLFAHPTEYGKMRGELRMTTTKVAWAADSGPARESIHWAQVTKNEYSIFDPAKAVDVVSVCLPLPLPLLLLSDTQQQKSLRSLPGCGEYVSSHLRR
jgi:hypothetical protein